MQGCQSSCACANLVYTAAKLVDAVGVISNLLIGSIELAAIYSVLGGCADFTCSYVGNLLVISIQAFIADIGLVANFDAFIADGGLACGYSYNTFLIIARPFALSKMRTHTNSLTILFFKKHCKPHVD